MPKSSGTAAGTIYWSEVDGEAGVEYRFTLHSTHRKTSRSVTPNPGNTLKEPMPADHPADTLILLRVSPLHASLTAIQLRPLVGGIHSSTPDADSDGPGADPAELPVLLRLGSRLTTVLEQRLGDVHLGMIVSVGAQLTPRNSRLEDPGFPHTEAIYMRMPLTALSRALDGATSEIRKDWFGRKQQLPPLQLTVRLLHRDRGAGLDSVLADRRMETAALGSMRELWEGVILLDRKF